ncbi:MFS transporter [Bacillus paralicheniformis]|uniref:MFS transporter n=1 Tax=Bacillus paralicheniformis TaxID=1648923 RepID=UPI0011AA8AA0|nr:MFS transporter [Bacillus paralicheniformis]TWK42772.1 hypothetical protein CHCC20348_0484 [Bacillus paralicheniformis]
MLSVLKNKNFLFLILGRLVTNIGDSMYTVAAMWLVFDLSKSTFYSGLAGFLTMFPTVLQFLTGPIVDKVRLNKVLVWSQLIQAILVLIIPFFYFSGYLNIWIVMMIMPLIVFIEQFTYPAQSAALPKIIKSQDLVKANSIMSFSYQGTDIIFTGIAGIVIASAGAISIYLVDSFTFLLAALFFKCVKLEQKNEIEHKPRFHFKKVIHNYTTDIKEGFTLIRHSLIPKILLGSMISNFMLSATIVILPSFSSIRGGEEYYGYYLASMSCGLLLGSIFATVFGRFSIGSLTIYGFFISGVLWSISAIATSSYISIILFGLSQISIGVTNVIFMSILQSILPEEFIGRVFSFIASLTSIAAPFGSLLGGFTASLIGSDKVFFIGGIAMLFVSVYWVFQSSLRSIPSSEKINAKEYSFFTNVLNK